MHEPIEIPETPLDPSDALKSPERLAFETAQDIMSRYSQTAIASPGEWQDECDDRTYRVEYLETLAVPVQSSGGEISFYLTQAVRLIDGTTFPAEDGATLFLVSHQDEEHTGTFSISPEQPIKGRDNTPLDRAQAESILKALVQFRDWHNTNGTTARPNDIDTYPRHYHTPLLSNYPEELLQTDSLSFN